jgi:hypothetical protein
MVPKESRIFSKQFREMVKIEREREWTHTKRVKNFFKTT